VAQSCDLHYIHRLANEFGNTFVVAVPVSASIGQPLLGSEILAVEAGWLELGGRGSELDARSKATMCWNGMIDLVLFFCGS
jgi:hypothetical protein